MSPFPISDSNLFRSVSCVLLVCLWVPEVCLSCAGIASQCDCAGIKKEEKKRKKDIASSRSFSYPGLIKAIIIMDPNATTTAATAAAATPGYPVIPPQQQQQQHYGQQFPFHPSVMSPFPQAKPPSQQPSFGAVPFSQAGGPGGAPTMMPAAAGFPPQHSSGTLVIFSFYCPFFFFF